MITKEEDKNTKMNIETIKFLHKLVALVFVTNLTACTSVPARPSACIDGWSTDASGSSILLELPPNELESIEEVLVLRGRIECVHRMPSGKVVVVQRVAEQLNAVEIDMNADAYAEISRNLIISFN